ISIETKSKSKNYTFFHLFYTSKFARYTIALGFSLTVTSIIFYSLLFNIESLSGSIYWNSVLVAAIRFVANMSIASLERGIKCIGRKMIHFGSLVVVEIGLIILLSIIVTGTQAEFSLFSRIAALGIIGIASQFYIITAVVSNELFPTCIRNLSYSFTQFCSKIGVIIAPNIFALQIYLLRNYDSGLSLYWEALPYTIMLVLAVMNQFLFQFNIAETKGKPLNDHMPGSEKRVFKSNRATNGKIIKDSEATQKLKENEV
uniref:Uncharacterized protein n=1 Tax=Acrobeloides nanus TaxID=290746 RepID=A0A914CZR6_9BILA